MVFPTKTNYLFGTTYAYMRLNTPTAYQEESYSWSDLKELFISLKQYIISIHTRSAFGVDQAIIRFDNGYG